MKRAIMYAVLILLAFMLQNNMFAAVSWIDCTPNVLLIITFCFGFIHGRGSGMAIGFVSGLLLDFFFGNIIGFYALIYMVIGYGNGMLGQLFYVEMLNMPVVLCIISDLLFSLYVFVFSFLLRGVTDVGYYLVNVILPEMIYTVIITMIVYRPLLRLDDWMTEWEKRSAKSFV